MAVPYRDDDDDDDDHDSDNDNNNGEEEDAFGSARHWQQQQTTSGLRDNRNSANWGRDSSPEPSLSLVSEGGLHIDSPEEHDDAGSPILPLHSTILPVWLREQSASFRLNWLPLPIRRAGRFVKDWTKGPEVAQIQHVQPWLPGVQDLPLRLVKILLPKLWQQGVALFSLLGIWLLVFCLVLSAQQSSGKIEGYGHPHSIWCGASYWNDGNQCGIGGSDCRPFDNYSIPFKCRADCLSVKQLETYVIGDQEIRYTPLIVGGAAGDDNKDDSQPVYRADSFICQAAIHAGIITNEAGGCGVVELAGGRQSYQGSTSNDVTSYGFDGGFPKSFTFRRDISPECGAVDMRWKLLGVTITCTVLVSLFGASPAVYFPVIFTLLFFHVGLVSDPPNAGDMASIFSTVLGRFLPATFAAFVIYLTAVRPQLAGMTAQVEKTIFWLGATWVGALSNYTFDWLPVQRLTPRDLAQPGAVLTVVLIVLLIFAIALGQIYYLRLEKRLQKYLLIYALMGLGLLIGVAIPQLNLRIHHYILALLLLPGTRTQTRPAMIYQGILIGLFINGIARWGFDSILQTSYELFHRGDERSLLPNITLAANTTVFTRNITFDWDPVPPEGYDGVSVLVNDVERKRWYVGEGDPYLTWERAYYDDESTDQGEGEGEGHGHGEKLYFRFAFMQGSTARDFTRAGTWHPNGSWSHMLPGTHNT